MLTEDYKEATHDSVYVRYPVENEEDTYLLVWTTTPWTLPANVAIAVDPDKDYAVVLDDSESLKGKYYMGKAAVERMSLKAEKVIKGQELVGKKYSSPFDDLARVKDAMKDKVHEVIATDTLILPISDVEGTGLVHIATGAGVEDFKLGKAQSLPVIEVIDEEANYLEGLEDFSGKNAKDYPEIIIDFIKEQTSLFYQEKITHRYPACWRCKTELVWRVVDEWYISMDPLREPMKEVAKKIKWLPEFGLKRELDWLDNMHDWLISKKRYWGLALPIWVCEKCEKFDVVGDKKELQDRADSGWEEFEGNTPHRPYVDEVKLKCECGGTMTRIADVGNPWLDAGIVPYSTMSDEWRPADFITESFPGQFKNWFYSLIAMSTVLGNEEPTKNILGFATLLAEDGRPMHKSWGNSIEFNEGADKIGVDIMRWMFAKQDPASNMLFGYKTADETRRGFYLTFWNIYNFFVTYANTDGWSFDPAGKMDVSNPLDVWILCRLYDTVNITTNSLENYDARTPATAIEGFVSDLSVWYVRRSRDRIGNNAQDHEDKNNCYNVLHFVLVNLCRMLAPFMPFITDEMFKNLTSGRDVHLSSWVKEGLEDQVANIVKEVMVSVAELKVSMIVDIKVGPNWADLQHHSKYA